MDTQEVSREVTEREIYNKYFLSLHKSCMKMAIEEAQEMSKTYGVPIELFDISALTFQHYKMWQDRSTWIKEKQTELQTKIDKENKKYA